jgi:WD40 repeat protein
MLRHRVKINETDRFIAARSTDREMMIDRYKIKDKNSNLNKFNLDEIEGNSQICKSAEPKTRTPLIVRDKKQIQEKLYLTLLKTQLFKKETITEKKPVRGNYHLSSKKRRRSTENSSPMNNMFVRKNNENLQGNINLQNAPQLPYVPTLQPDREMINLGLTHTPLRSHHQHQLLLPSSSVKFPIRKLNFNTSMTESKNLPNFKKQRLDIDTLDFNSGNQFKSSFKELVNFDLSHEDSFSYKSYGILNNKKNISSSAYKILDAPTLKDDFYLHLLDWSKKGIIAVGLESSVYLWDSFSSSIGIVKSNLNGEDKVTSVQWLSEGEQLLIGHNSGKILIWDIVKDKRVLSYEDHINRVGCFAGVPDSQFLFSSGSLDHNIHNYDLRTREIITKFTGHTQEVCGLQWSHDGKMLASGGNDNKLMLWTLRKSQPEKKFSSHQSAIKAISWSYQKFGLLASGGGTQDRTIKLWNTNTMTMVESIDTNSQVCNISFSRNTNEFVTTHGYSDNLILVWDFEKLEVIATLKGHRDRVIYMSNSPDGGKIVTGAGDETIRFWEVFKTEEKSDEGERNSGLIKNFKIR